MSDYEIERLYEIWDNQHGEKLEVGADRDGLGLVEIRRIGENKEVVARIDMPRELASLVAVALSEYLQATRDE